MVFFKNNTNSTSITFWIIVLRSAVFLRGSFYLLGFEIYTGGGVEEY